MSNLHLLMYCNGPYRPIQDYIVKQLKESEILSSVTALNDSDLIQTDFFKEHKHILSEKQGAGYCLWKPYYISQILPKMQDNDVLFYLDSLDYVYRPKTFKSICEEILKFQDYIFFGGGFKQKEYTRYDTFHLMGLLEEKYTDAIQMEAGIMLLKNTPFIKALVEEWLHYCTDPQIIMNIPNVYGDNFLEYKDHRYDQSVLTNLIIKYGLNLVPMEHELRSTFQCNYYFLKKDNK